MLDDALTIACGDGAVRLIEVQRAGKRAMSAAEFLRGFRAAQGPALAIVLTARLNARALSAAD